LDKIIIANLNLIFVQAAAQSPTHTADPQDLLNLEPFMLNGSSRPTDSAIIIFSSISASLQEMTNKTLVISQEAGFLSRNRKATPKTMFIVLFLSQMDFSQKCPPQESFLLTGQ
jgi:hypothetical protein